MGTKGKVTFTYMNESGDIQPGLSSVYLCPAGGTPGGASAVQMSDSDNNGTYITDLEDDAAWLDSGLYDVYAEGTKEIDSFVVINKDLIDDVVSFGASISDHESEIAAIQSTLATVTGDIVDLEGSVDDLQTDVAGLTTSLNAHIADNGDPHGATLSQSRFICSDIRGASGDSEFKIQGKNGVNAVNFIVENYGSPTGYDVNLTLKKGALRFGDADKTLYLSGEDMYLDIKDSADTEFHIFNSYANKDCRVIVDGGISADVDEVINARAGYANLDARLDAIVTSGSNFVGHIFENMPAAMGDDNTSSIVVADRIQIMLINIPFTLSVNRINISASVAGGTDDCSFGIYNNTGDLIVSVAKLTVSSGENNIALGQTVLLAPGEYYLAWTSSATTATLRGYTRASAMDLHQRWGYEVGTGGDTLPDKIGVDSIVVNNAFFPYMVLDSVSF